MSEMIPAIEPLTPGQHSPLKSDSHFLAKIFAGTEGISTHRAALFAFLLALSTAVFFTWVVRPIMHIERPLGGEGYDGYLELAQNLAHGNGYVLEPGGHKVFHRPPLYPGLLVPGMLLPESTWRLYVAILNSILFALASVSLLELARLTVGRRTAALAWLLFIFNPLLLVATKNAVPAMLQTCAYISILYWSYRFFLSIKHNKAPSTQFLVTYALILWAGAMSHGTMLVHSFLILGGFSLWICLKKSWRYLRPLCLVASLLVVAIAPWTWRNYKVTGLFLPVVGNSGLAYFAGNAHWGITLPPVGPNENRNAAELRHIGLDPARQKELISYYGFTNPSVEALADRKAKEHMRRHPADFSKKVFLNAIEYYAPIIFYIFPPAGSEAYGLPVGRKLAQPGVMGFLGLSLFTSALALGGLVGLWVVSKRSPFLALLFLAAWAAFALPYFPFLTFFAGRSYYTFGTFPVLSILMAAVLIPPKLGANAGSR